MHDPAKGHEALRRGRHTVEGASYFITLCVEERKSGLETATMTDEIMLHAKDTTCGWKLRTAVTMPDHMHLVIELLSEVALADAVRMFKGRTAVGLRRGGLKWQRGYYDHRLRLSDEAQPVFLYVFLNPYRAGLVPTERSWPGYYCAPDDWAWFGPLTSESCPFPEWLK